MKMNDFVKMLGNFEECIPYLKPVLRPTLSEEKISIPFLNLYIGIKVSVPCEERDGNITTFVTKEMATEWGVCEGQLLEKALNNSTGEFNITSLLGKVIECAKESKMEPEELGFSGDEPEDAYVLGNDSGIDGASVLLNTPFLSGVSSYLKDSFYVLPSSIHECIVMPKEMVTDVSELKRMVVEVNQTTVDERDFLSDSIYFFSKDEKQLRVVA